jgi:hypothetical protein
MERLLMLWDDTIPDTRLFRVCRWLIVKGLPWLLDAWSNSID